MKYFYLVILLLASFGLKARQPDSLINKPFVLGEIREINSTQLSEKRTLNIYLPEGYRKDDTLHYPVIYLLDGSANEDFIHICGLVQFFTLCEMMPKTIVVGIVNVDRKRDFTFPTTIAADKKDFPTTGGSAKFMTFMEKELQPYIDKMYKTNGSKMIIGQSLGGLLAIEILLKKASLFDHYVVISPSLWWDNESLLKQAPALLAKQAGKAASVYISVGSEGKQMENDAASLAELLPATGKKNLKVNFVPLPDENHLTILHNSVYKAFQLFFAKPGKHK